MKNRYYREDDVFSSLKDNFGIVIVRGGDVFYVYNDMRPRNLLDERGINSLFTFKRAASLANPKKRVFVFIKAEKKVYENSLSYFNEDSIVYRQANIFRSIQDVRNNIGLCDLVVIANGSGFYRFLCQPQNMLNGGNESTISSTLLMGLRNNENVEIVAGSGLDLKYSVLGGKLNMIFENIANP